MHEIGFRVIHFQEYLLESASRFVIRNFISTNCDLIPCRSANNNFQYHLTSYQWTHQRLLYNAGNLWIFSAFLFIYLFFILLLFFFFAMLTLNPMSLFLKLFLFFFLRLQLRMKFSFHANRAFPSVVDETQSKQFWYKSRSEFSTNYKYHCYKLTFNTPFVFWTWKLAC